MALRKSRFVPSVPAKPKCRVHGDMSYVPEDMAWKCNSPGCKAVRRPDLGSDSGKPVLLKGDLEAVLVTNPDGGTDLYIRSKGTDALVFVGPYLTGQLIENFQKLSLSFALEMPLIKAQA